MDVLVRLEESPAHSPVLAHVNSVPAPFDPQRSAREVVTLYGVPSPESLALALAAAVESRRSPREGADAITHVGVWPERGAIGDAAWRDSATGQLVRSDVDIPLEILRETARQLLAECGQLIRRLVAGLAMPDWPEDARRAIGFSLAPAIIHAGAGAAQLDARLELYREADGFTFDAEGD